MSRISKILILWFFVWEKLRWMQTIKLRCITVSCKMTVDCTESKKCVREMFIKKVPYAYTAFFQIHPMYVDLTRYTFATQISYQQIYFEFWLSGSHFECNLQYVSLLFQTEFCFRLFFYVGRIQLYTPIHIYIYFNTQKFMSDKILKAQFRTLWKCKFRERKRKCDFVCISKRPPHQIALGISSIYRNENWLEILKANVILFIIE